MSLYFFSPYLLGPVSATTSFRFGHEFNVYKHSAFMIGVTCMSILFFHSRIGAYLVTTKYCSLRRWVHVRTRHLRDTKGVRFSVEAPASTPLALKAFRSAMDKMVRTWQRYGQRYFVLKKRHVFLCVFLLRSVCRCCAPSAKCLSMLRSPLLLPVWRC